jgi:hypothetical protein
MIEPLDSVLEEAYIVENLQLSDGSTCNCLVERVLMGDSPESEEALQWVARQAEAARQICDDGLDRRSIRPLSSSLKWGWVYRAWEPVEGTAVIARAPGPPTPDRRQVSADAER